MKGKKPSQFACNPNIKILLLVIILIFYNFPLALSAPHQIRKIAVTLPDGREIESELADTPDLRSHGLMERSHLKPNEGMLFIFETESLQMMWMKNMIISIDMIWLNDKKEIIAIRTGLPPCRTEPCPVYGPPTPSRYVFEISAGGSAKFQLKEGMKLKFP